MFQSPCKLNLPCEDDSEEVSAVVLHICEEPQAFKIRRGHCVRFVDKYEHFFPFISRLKEKLVEGFQQVHLSLLFTLSAGKLPDNFS
ncbi:MAG: hypothetical protein A4E65_02638 [Syntrophorhabdus sp. PtaU1.Bin153]|nr:MAG: hypothetical protein A4E65_02638 [Syntrophorhabdus sp. PtaU1.Bin153]